MKKISPPLANELGMVEKLTGSKLSVFVIVKDSNTLDSYAEIEYAFLTEKAAKRWLRSMGRKYAEQSKKMFDPISPQAFMKDYEIREVELTLE